MSDELLRYYNSELQHLRRQGDEFARAHPEVASNLRVGTDGDYDPYVGRLVEAFAYLNARTRKRLEDGFPEIAGNYLDLLYPHYQRPVPAAMIAQFELSHGQAEQYEGQPIPRGTSVVAPRAGGVACRFRTTHDLHLWPFEIRDASLRGTPFRAPKLELPELPLGLLKLQLATQAPDVMFSSFDVQTLRFFLRLPAPYCYQLYELLFDDVLAVAIATDPEATPTVLSANAIRPVGFDDQEGLVEYPPQSFLGYRLLSEFFSFPEKFLFFDLQLPRHSLPDSERMEVFLYTRKRWADLEPAVSREAIRLGCCPCVNLFPKRLEPVRLTHHQTDYRLEADVSHPEAYEIYSIDRVEGVGEDRETFEYLPFYEPQHGRNGRHYWHAERHTAVGDGSSRRGTEMSLALVDLEFDPTRHVGWRSTVHVDATCTNRTLPENLPIIPDQSQLELDVAGSVGRCVCLTKPSRCVWPPMGKERRWRLISHLALNHLSVSDGEDGCQSLKEILELYAFSPSEASRSVISGIRSVSSEPAVGRLPGDASGAICRGVQVTITFDESKYSGGNLFLFGAVLDRFFSLYANLNSFTRTVAYSTERSGVFHEWPARVGQQRVL